jgi:hypothetical protein
LKQWWNGGIKERRSQLGGAKRRRRRSAATAQAKSELQRSIQRTQDRTCNNYLKIVSGAEVSRAAKFANPRTGATVEALTNKAGEQVNPVTKKRRNVETRVLSHE